MVTPETLTYEQIEDLRNDWPGGSAVYNDCVRALGTDPKRGGFLLVHEQAAARQRVCDYINSAAEAKRIALAATDPGPCVVFAVMRDDGNHCCPATEIDSVWSDRARAERRAAMLKSAGTIAHVDEVGVDCEVAGV